MPPPLLFCNVGWMNHYLGQTSKDKIIGGGRYVKIEERGGEVCNFVVSNDKLFGYVQPVRGCIAIQKLGALSKAEFIEGVNVIITARRPGGSTVIVGWYKNATVYRAFQPLRASSALHRKNDVDGYRFEARATDAKLLRPEQRTFLIPRRKNGMGQSNVWYAQAASQKWLTQVRRFIQNEGDIKSIDRKSKKPDHFKNALVEDAAIKHVWSHYENRGYVVEDVSKENRGWDLEAISGSLKLRIEVKRISATSPAVELTPNEYKAFSEKSHLYRLCIVTNALQNPLLTTCSINLASDE